MYEHFGQLGQRIVLHFGRIGNPSIPFRIGQTRSEAPTKHSEMTVFVGLPNRVRLGLTRRSLPRQWWDNQRHDFEIVSSSAVVEELQNGKDTKKDKCLSLLDDIPFLIVGTEIAEITDTYIQHKIMPNDPTGDALHLAIASYHKCDFLLTWNCKHLANANKFQHIKRINTRLGLFVPTLVTPLELLGVY